MERSDARTAEVLERHLQSLNAGDLDAIIADYAPDVVALTPGGFFSPDGILRGRQAMRQAFATLLSDFQKPGASFTLKQTSIEGDYAYIVWSAETPDNIYEAGSDTFVVRNGKIAAQTFAGKIVPRTAVTAAQPNETE